ncbi:hypothetical protein A2U01_0042915, partial [Trifolium medium]|nr:hypothetical protein [Trifolium medium]
MLLWSIWHNRNDEVWNDNVQMPNQIGRHVFDAWNMIGTQFINYIVTTRVGLQNQVYYGGKNQIQTG